MPQLSHAKGPRAPLWDQLRLMAFELHDFAARYAAAWCSRAAARVAGSRGHFDPTGYQRQIQQD